MSETQSLLAYKGQFDNSVLRSLLKQTDELLMERGENRITIKKINSILIELLQNLAMHSVKKGTPVGYLPEVQVYSLDDQYELQVCNLASRENALRLQERIDNLKSLDEQALRNLYQEVLTNGEFNQAGGAGLGLINIARKINTTGMRYDLEPLSEDRAFIRLRVVV